MSITEPSPDCPDCCLADCCHFPIPFVLIYDCCWYDAAIKYVCSKNGVFFTLPMKNEENAYYNEIMQELK